jgi:hypothetical protein
MHTHSQDIYTVILIIIIIVIIAIIVTWGCASKLGCSDDFYNVGDVWHGPGFYKVCNVNTQSKDKAPRIDNVIKITYLDRDIMCIDYDWATVDDCGRNVTARGSKQFQGGVSLRGRARLTEIGGAGVAFIEPACDKIRFTYNSIGVDPRFNGKVTIVAELEKFKEECAKW